MNNRILPRSLARELTADEVAQVSGAGSNPWCNERVWIEDPSYPNGGYWYKTPDVLQ